MELMELSDFIDTSKKNKIIPVSKHYIETFVPANSMEHRFLPNKIAPYA